MTNDNGFIMLNRKLFSNRMWKEARTFSDCEAWIDLIQSARFDAMPRKESIGGREVIYCRGQYPASQRFLAKRWMWSEKKVRSFLEHLKKENMITIDCTQGMNIITLCKYDDYNPLGAVEEPPNGADNDLVLKQLANELAQLRAQLWNHPTEEGRTEGANSNKEEEINNTIPPIPPKGGGEKPKVSNPVSKKKDSLNTKARAVFESHFLDTFGNSYYWTAKDAGNMKQLLQKLKHSREQRNKSVDDDDIISALKAFLSCIKDGWIYQNFSVANINSKFNEIVSSISNNGKTKQGVMPYQDKWQRKDAAIQQSKLDSMARIAEYDRQFAERREAIEAANGLIEVISETE